MSANNRVVFSRDGFQAKQVWYEGTNHSGKYKE